MAEIRCFEGEYKDEDRGYRGTETWRRAGESGVEP